MKVIPYTTCTGVKIGSRWNESPKPMPIDDPDMIAIQGWFIHTPKWHKARNRERFLYLWFTGFSLLICVLMAVK